MEKRHRNQYGICLVGGSILMVVTMILHPAGGDPGHILRIKSIIIAAHALAILSIPFTTLGFWGLSNALMTPSRLSILAFVFSAFGLTAAMIAAATNGLALPMFLESILPEDLDNESVRVAVTYGMNFNRAMDYILIAALAISIFIWSIIIIRKGYATWIGYYGMVVILTVLAYAIHSDDITGLSPFRIVVFLVVSWIVITGIKLLLMQRIENKNSN